MEQSRIALPLNGPRWEASRWRRQAEHDGSVARRHLEAGAFSDACFMSQQWAVKNLKGLVYLRGDRAATVHSVTDLLSDLEPDYPELGIVRLTAGSLDQYYEATRYPGQFSEGIPFQAFTSEQAESAIQAAAELADVARRRLPTAP